VVADVDPVVHRDGLIRSLPDPWLRVVAHYRPACGDCPGPNRSRRPRPRSRRDEPYRLRADRVEQCEYVIGVDTHSAAHTFALVVAATGALLAHAEFPTSPAGLSRAQSWLQQRVSERATLIVVEGTGSFGAIVTERLQRAGLSVVEAARMPASDRRGIGKNDELDATRIARAVLGLPLTSLRTPRELSSERARVAMRVLVVAPVG